MKHPKDEIRIIVCAESGIVYDGYIKRKDNTMIEITMLEGIFSVEYSDLGEKEHTP